MVSGYAALLANDGGEDVFAWLRRQNNPRQVGGVVVGFGTKVQPPQATSATGDAVEQNRRPLIRPADVDEQLREMDQ